MDRLLLRYLQTLWVQLSWMFAHSLAFPVIRVLLCSPAGSMVFVFSRERIRTRDTEHSIEDRVALLRRKEK